MRTQIERWLLPAGLVAVAWLKWPGAWLAYSQGKWLAVHFVALAATALAVWRGPRLPKLRAGEAVLLAAAFLGALAQTVRFSPVGFEFFLVDRWSFAVVALAAWHAFRSGALRPGDFWWPLAAALTVVSAIGLYQLWEIGFPGEMPYTSVGSAFGHANNAAQFVGLSLLLWWGLPRPRLPAWALPVLSALPLTYFLFLRGRSTYIGLGLGLLVLGGLRLRERRVLRARGVLAAAALVLVLFGGFQLARGQSWSDLAHLRVFAEKKSSMVRFRENVWRQTLAMIRDRPLGVGPGRFTFQFVPYYMRGREPVSETSVIDTPHNDVLRYLAEDGVALAPLYLLALAYILARWLRLRRDWNLWLPPLAFLAFETVTQFPFSNPFPSYVLALFLGYAGAQVWTGEARLRPGWARGAAAALGVLQLFFAAKVVVARTFEHSESLERAKLSCRMVPRNWQSCLMVTRIQLDRGELGGAREAAEDILFHDPWNFTAMRYLSIIGFRQGDRLEGCYYLWKYDHVFQEASSIHDKVGLNCPEKWLSYFRRKHPAAYMPRYKAFLDREKDRSALRATFRFWE